MDTPKPTRNRIVEYVLKTGKETAGPDDCRPAIITRVKDGNVVNLNIFLDAEDKVDERMSAVRMADVANDDGKEEVVKPKGKAKPEDKAEPEVKQTAYKPGTWHFPIRV